MTRKWILFFLLLGVGLFGLAVWQAGWLASTAKVMPKGDEGTPAITYVTLITSIVSLITAIVGLIKASMEAKKFVSKPPQLK